MVHAVELRGAGGDRMVSLAFKKKSSLAVFDWLEELARFFEICGNPVDILL